MLKFKQAEDALLVIRECGSTLCRIDGYCSDANTKVYGDGSIFSF